MNVFFLNSHLYLKKKKKTPFNQPFLLPPSLPATYKFLTIRPQPYPTGILIRDLSSTLTGKMHFKVASYMKEKRSISVIWNFGDPWEWGGVVRCYLLPKDSAICGFGYQTYLMGEVQDRKEKLHLEMATFEVTWSLRSGEEALIRNLLLPIPGSVW